jgi:hypothetical protein
MLGSNPTRDNQVRTGEWPAEALRDLPLRAVLFVPIHLACHASKTPNLHRRMDRHAACSASIRSSFSLAPFAHPCQRGIWIARPPA